MKTLSWCRGIRRTARTYSSTSASSSGRRAENEGGRHKYGAWVRNRDELGGRAVGEGKGMSVFGGYAEEYDAQRPSYPATMWDAAISLLLKWRHASQGDLSLLSAVDVAAGTGRGALELLTRGFGDVAAVDLDAGMLEQLEKRYHEKQKVSGDQMDGKMAESRLRTLHSSGDAVSELEDGSVDLVVCLQAFHWFSSYDIALREFHRLLSRKGTRESDGLLLVAWNDRDQSVEWVQKYEALLEKYNPAYDRSLKLAEAVTREGAIFTDTGLFDIIAGTELPAPLSRTRGVTASDGGSGRNPTLRIENPMENCTAETLNALGRTFSYVRNALTEGELESFEREVTALIAEYLRQNGCVDGFFNLPFITKVYLLRPRTLPPQ